MKKILTGLFLMASMLIHAQSNTNDDVYYAHMNNKPDAQNGNTQNNSNNNYNPAVPVIMGAVNTLLFVECFIPRIFWGIPFGFHGLRMHSFPVGRGFHRR